MAPGSIFSVEEEIIADIDALISASGATETDLRKGLNRLLAAYQRLYKEEKKLIRVNDRQQNQMNRLNRELKKAKDIAEAASKSKGDFLANMSHEIRTPMNAIIGLTELCLRTKLTPQQQDYLSKIESSANSLLGIINDILDFSKIEVGKLALEHIDFELNEVLENLTNLIAVRAEEKNLELLFNVDPSIPATLQGDPLRLGQILINLTSNAIKFTEKGEILVKVEFGESPEVAPDQVTLKFSIQDTGIGLTPDQMERLFQSFSQADQSTTRKYGGTGLGLNISKRLSEMMGGEIWVESEAGKGSTFSFTARFGVRTGKVALSTRLISSLEGLKILVVDDNPKSREILDGMLSAYASVFQAASAHESFSDLLAADKEGEPFDIVLMDWKMPVMDGLEAIHYIRGGMDLDHQPIIFLVTAYGREEIRQKVKKADIDGYLIKPVTSTLLFSKINSVVGEESENMAMKASPKPSDAEVLKRIRGARILLVEDNEINQQVANELLTQAGLAVTVADSGHGAVDSIQKDRYDLIFMDVQMPDLDGYQTTRIIRKLEDNLKSVAAEDGDVSPFSPFPVPQVPIVAMTANAMVGDREKCLAAGMNDYVTKPISPRALSAVLKEWIQPGKREIRAACGHTAAMDDTGDLPARIPGIDIHAGVRNVGENRTLYKKILMKFFRHNRNKIPELQAALDREDYPELIHQAHTIKGVAGNIGAGELYRASAALELSLKNKETGHARFLLNMMAHKLNGILDALAPLSLRSQEEGTGEALANLPGPELEEKERTADLLQNMADLLENDIAESKNMLEELSRILGPIPEIQNMYAAFDDYDWDDVLVNIQNLAKRLDLSINIEI